MVTSFSLFTSSVLPFIDATSFFTLPIDAREHTLITVLATMHTARNTAKTTTSFPFKISFMLSSISINFVHIVILVIVHVKH